MDAHEVIDIPVPDYSDSYPHTQTTRTEAHALVPGDEILIRDRAELGWPEPYPGTIKGLMYRIITSARVSAHDGPGWSILASGATLSRFRIEPTEKFLRVAEHIPATCDYCLSRFNRAKEQAEAIKYAADKLHKLGYRAYNRPAPAARSVAIDDSADGGLRWEVVE